MKILQSLYEVVFLFFERNNQSTLLGKSTITPCFLCSESYSKIFGYLASNIDEKKGLCRPVQNLKKKKLTSNTNV